ncbi:cAMP-regulated phosphoprotein 19 [Neocloeon triangulifer]|uniref:cAMP-regulated phosphoprotein 19 n=1 Tax=Neocloeon triangulifer TaxID=2078957 RepID=UPI00286F100D|nr:cAMP-regulated phosphoprotein 19 [Neocloeon triangulifer]
MSDSAENAPQDEVSSPEEAETKEFVQPSQQEIEKLEEAKLKARYPKNIQPMSGHSAFLQKRLAKGQKFFDSGDYQMAKQKSSSVAAAAKPRVTSVMQPFATGEAIPTPETVPVRKTSIIQQPKLNFNNTNSSN